MAGRCVLTLAAAALAASTGLAAAAGLTPQDYRYLAARYGLGPKSDVLAAMSPDEQSSLHGLIAGLEGEPAQRDDAVRNRLYEAYARECEAWAEQHGEGCPPTTSGAAAQGQAIADRICNTCHRFGSGMAPSFFALAQQRRWDAAAVADALAHSHDMVPLALPEDERQSLAAYINAQH